MSKSINGFTIVELLIVIVIIAILAAISIVAYGGITVRAQASAVASDLRATEKALNSLKVINGPSDWWVDTDASFSGSGGGNPRISLIIAAQPELRKLLTTEPTTEGLNTPNKWFYDYDNDTYNGCSASVAGANLVLFNPQNATLVQLIDDKIDDGNLACGKIRMSGSNFVYGLN